MARLTVKEFINPAQLKAELAFKESEINQALMEHPAKFGYYAMLYYESERQTLKLKQILEITEAKVDGEIRAQYEGAGKPPTEAQIKSKIVRHTEVIAAQRAYNKAKTIQQLCKHAVDAFRHRKDMLIQVSFNRRAEIQGEIRVMEGRSDPVDMKRAGIDALKRANREAA